MSYLANQTKAAIIISRYSLLAMLRSPTAIVFSLLFPVIFITVFGSIISSKTLVMTLAVAPGSDTSGPAFRIVRQLPAVILQTGRSTTQLREDLEKGKIDAVLTITGQNSGRAAAHYVIHLQVAPPAGSKAGLLETMLNAAIAKANQKAFPGNLSIAALVVSKARGRIYRSIDFILPGQLGFSLLMAGIYGSSFLLFSLRQNLVLKRLRTAPISRFSIIAGEMLSRLFFHIISFIIMVALGYFAFNFTLVNGFVTFIEMLAFSLLGLFIFMGTGFIISGLVQNENAIAPIANTVVLPQILLCGLFFPIDNYPHWLEQFCNILPLTLFVDGLRKIAFEGTPVGNMLSTYAGLILWTLFIVPLAVKSFKWE